MSPPGPNLIVLEVPCDRRAPATVRRALAETNSELLEDGVLLASELVTNAVLHSGCDGRDVLQVHATVSRDRLRISVGGAGRRRYSVPARAIDAPAFGPWGSRVIDRLSQRWACERPAGYRVWAELARPA